MTRQEIDGWADAYIDAQQDPTILADDNSNWWAVLDFMCYLDGGPSPEDCWNAILAVLARSPPDQVIGMLAAGPLEDLIEWRGAEFIDRIEAEARRDAAFRDLLSRVWESSTPDVWARVLAAQERLGKSRS